MLPFWWYSLEIIYKIIAYIKYYMNKSILLDYRIYKIYKEINK